ncbi:predicted protein [Botrytis cinerea T4]|uniref:Uncharacterized protein n=1 Tax=Botryotinia fuckeliana (strain T4) TaxID=999810 RepID=G2YK04_BOTF4|nr:predicted protein [Botrytis cinerea T4]
MLLGRFMGHPAHGADASEGDRTTPIPHPTRYKFKIDGQSKETRHIDFAYGVGCY